VSEADDLAGRAARWFPLVDNSRLLYVHLHKWAESAVEFMSECVFLRCEVRPRPYPRTEGDAVAVVGVGRLSVRCLENYPEHDVGSRLVSRHSIPCGRRRLDFLQYAFMDDFPSVARLRSVVSAGILMEPPPSLAMPAEWLDASARKVRERRLSALSRAATMAVDAGVPAEDMYETLGLAIARPVLES
jgi:hypothetical protein